MTEDAIAQMSIGTLKSVLFQNHVNARLLLEKSDLVAKVRALVADERREREREAALRAREEQEIIERQHAMMEEHRMREEQLRLEREVREREELERARAGDSVQDDGEAGVPLERPGDSPRGGDAKTSSPVGPSISSSLERSGLCIICQDEEANIAIVDCGCVPVSILSLSVRAMLISRQTPCDVSWLFGTRDVVFARVPLVQDSNRDGGAVAADIQDVTRWVFIRLNSFVSGFRTVARAFSVIYVDVGPGGCR